MACVGGGSLGYGGGGPLGCADGGLLGCVGGISLGYGGGGSLGCVGGGSLRYCGRSCTTICCSSGVLLATRCISSGVRRLEALAFASR